MQNGQRATSNPAVRFVLFLALTTMTHSAWPARNVTTQSVAFGTYDVFSGQSVESTGNVAVTCDVSTLYSISLSPGNGSFASRGMTNGTHQLNYNLFTDATRTTIWGDGSSGTAVVSASGISGNHTVYGRIPASQNAHVGSYSDSIIVTVNY